MRGAVGVGKRMLRETSTRIATTAVASALGLDEEHRAKQEDDEEDERERPKPVSSARSARERKRHARVGQPRAQERRRKRQHVAPPGQGDRESQVSKIHRSRRARVGRHLLACAALYRGLRGAASER